MAVIAHMDLDAFFAACEIIAHPEWAALPLVVGGDPHGRGVVSTASYPARAYGIRSAMSCAEARRRCPEAIFVRPEMERYRAHSRAVWDRVRARIAAVEQTGIDEGYLDLAPHARTVGALRVLLTDLRDEILAECGLDVSFGVGTSKTVAKIASDQDKPRGLVIVPPGREAAFLAPLPLRALPGAGPVTCARLATQGVHTIGDLAGLGPDVVRRILPGAHGADLHRRAQGIDERPVDPTPAARQSIGHETTFDEDIADPALLVSHVEELVRRTVDRLQADGRACGTVTVKLRYPDFTLITRARSTHHPTDDPVEITRLAEVALGRARVARPDPVRLIGVSLSRLTQGAQLQITA